MGSPCSSLLPDPAYKLLLKDTLEATMGPKIEISGHDKIPTQRLLTQILVDEPNHKALIFLIAPLEDSRLSLK
jgi:hypothetical protein